MNGHPHRRSLRRVPDRRFDDRGAKLGPRQAASGRESARRKNRPLRRLLSEGSPRGVSRTDRPNGGYRAGFRRPIMVTMLWVLALVAICPLVSLAAERLTARIPTEAGR